jgi:sugar phosphate isomerase/epimerase
MTTPLALSTRWNANRHTDGRAMVEEILALGFTRIEVGYDLRPELMEGLLAMVRERAVEVVSVHNFCPVPPGAPRPHPELYTPGAPDRREREAAVKHIANTLRFAAGVGARVVVCHSGNVDMPNYTYDLLRLAAEGRQYTEPYERLKYKLLLARDKRAPAQIAALSASLDALAPVLAETRVALALENLPTWEALPTELEAEQLLRRHAPSGVRFWCDLGHTQIRENLGFINATRWLQRLSPWLAGFHVHDVAPPGDDHLMPPHGKTDFTRFAEYAAKDIPLVLEPRPNTPPEDLLAAVPLLHAAWNFPPP